MKYVSFNIYEIEGEKKKEDQGHVTYVNDIFWNAFQDFHNFLLDSVSDSASCLTTLALSKAKAAKRYSTYLSSIRPSPGGGNGDLDSLMNGAIRKKLRIIPERVT